MALQFFERFRQNLQQIPEHIVLQNITREGKESFAYRRVAEELGKISLFLKNQGVRSGNSIGIIMENHPRWGIAFLAAQSAGARIVPLDVLHESSTLAQLIQHSECQYLITSAGLAPKISEIQELLPEPLPVLMTGPPLKAYSHWDTVLAEVKEVASIPIEERDPDEPLVILYTSGTTGDPKGVMLTQRSIYRNAEALVAMFGVTSSDHVLSVLPLYHILALMANFIVPLYEGARVTYLDSLDATRILNTFVNESITIFICVPQFYYLIQRKILTQVEQQSFLKRLMFRRLSNLSRLCIKTVGWNPGKLFFPPLHQPFGPKFRFFAVGGARFAPEVATLLRDLGFTITQAYGMTETAAVATATSSDMQAVGSVGRPLSHVSIRIDQPDEGGVGEVLISGENVMKGYWKNPRATEEVLQNHWLHSGDLGYLDSSGYLHITGRKKDVIVLSSGKNVFPDEVEHFYQNLCRYIKEMCVLGIRDESSGEEQESLHAVVVPDFEYMKSQQTVNAHDMIRYKLDTLSQRLPSYKRVHSFEIRQEPLPRTTTRKIKRFQVGKELQKKAFGTEQSRFQKPSQPHTAAEETIFRLIREAKKTSLVHREMNLELDLGFDSLERIELLSNLQETFQIHLCDDLSLQLFTVADLIQTVEREITETSTTEKRAHLSWSEILYEPLQEQDRQRVETTLSPNAFAEAAMYLTAKLVYILAKLSFRLKAEGLHHLPTHHPYLICPNHLSYLDAFLVVAPLPYSVISKIFFLGYSDYFVGPVMSFLGHLLKVVPVDADRHLRQALRLGAEGLSRKLTLCVFPEGERSIDGKLKPFRKGAAILAKEIKVPVVPVAIIGTYEAWARGVDRIRMNPVTVRFGHPLDPPSSEESYETFNERLFQAIQQLTLQEDS